MSTRSTRSCTIGTEVKKELTDAIVKTQFFRYITEESGLRCSIVQPEGDAEPMTMEEMFTLLLSNHAMSSFQNKEKAHVVVTAFEIVLNDPSTYAQTMYKNFLTDTAEKFYKSFSALLEERIFGDVVSTIIGTGVHYIRHRYETFDPANIKLALKWMSQGKPMDTDSAVEKRLGKKAATVAPEGAVIVAEDTHILAVGAAMYPWNPEMGGLGCDLEPIFTAKPDLKGWARKNKVSEAAVIKACDKMSPENRDVGADFKSWTKQMSIRDLLSLFPRNNSMPPGVAAENVHFFRSDPAKKQRLVVDMFRGDSKKFIEWAKSTPTIEFVVRGDGRYELSNGNNQVLNAFAALDDPEGMVVNTKEGKVPCDDYMKQLPLDNPVCVKYTQAGTDKLESYVDMQKKGRQEEFFHVMKDGHVKKTLPAILGLEMTSEDGPIPMPFYGYTTQQILALQMKHMNKGFAWILLQVIEYYKGINKRGYVAGARTVLDALELLFARILACTMLRSGLAHATVKVELGDAWMSEMLWALNVGHGITLRGKRSRNVEKLIAENARDPREIGAAIRAIDFLWDHAKKAHSVPSMVSMMPMVGDVCRDLDTEKMKPAFDAIVACKSNLPCSHGVMTDEQYEIYTALHNLKFANISNWQREENCRSVVAKEEVNKASEALSMLKDYPGFKTALDAALAKHKEVVAERARLAALAKAAKAAKSAKPAEAAKSAKPAEAAKSAKPAEVTTQECGKRPREEDATSSSGGE